MLFRSRTINIAHRFVRGRACSFSLVPGCVAVSSSGDDLFQYSLDAIYLLIDQHEERLERFCETEGAVLNVHKEENDGKSAADVKNLVARHVIDDRWNFLSTSLGCRSLGCNTVVKGREKCRREEGCENTRIRYSYEHVCRD